MSSLGHVRDVVSTGSVEGQRELGALDDLDNVCRRLSRGCVAGQRWVVGSMEGKPARTGATFGIYKKPLHRWGHRRYVLDP
jgi:hypothetical protein